MDVIHAIGSPRLETDRSDGNALTDEVVAFGRIVEAHQRDVLRLCYAICGDVERARDASQRTWLAAWRSRRQLREPARLRGWLAVIAIRECRRELRARRQSRIRELPSSEVDPWLLERSHVAPASAHDPDLARALAELGPDDRALVTLRYVLGFDSFEIARMVGRSASGTRARLARILSRLREGLGE